jgi:hypothetical protein
MWRALCHLNNKKGTQMETIEERVARGAALLDQHRPGWEGEIRLGDLNIGSTQWCVLGQLHDGRNGYSTGLRELGLIGNKDAVRYGFTAGIDPAPWSYRRLTEAWCTYIARRREHATSHEFTLPT